MNILFVISTCGCFDSVKTGGAVRNNMFVKALSQIGHVDVISFYEEPLASNLPNCEVVFSKYIENGDDKRNYLYFIRRLLWPLILPNYPYSYYKKNKEREKIVDNYVKKRGYDIIACRYIENIITCGLLKYTSKLVIDVDDNPANLFKIYAAREFKYPIINWRLKLEANKIGGMVERLLPRVRCSFYSNKVESPSPTSVYLHNVTLMKAVITDINEFTPNRILFVGSNTYPPNREGIRYFSETIFPLIKKKIPDVELRIVGQGKKTFLDSLNRIEGVVAPGFVDDLAVEYNNARVVIIPIYQGSGTCVKFIEALSMNRPIVSTPFGARGFDEFCVAGEHYMLAKNDEDFAGKVIDLLSSLEMSKVMASKAKEIPDKYFSQVEFERIVKEAILGSN